MTAYVDLMAFQRETEALAQVMGRLGWDQETMMPSGAAAQRAEEMAALEGVLHARRTDPRLGEWLAASEAGDETAGANLREIRRRYERNLRVPARLAAELARVTSRAQGIWAEARRNEDVAAFLPVLEEVVRLRREEGQAIANGGDVYDALLHDYEPGTSSAELTAMFGALRPRLVALRETIKAAPQVPEMQGSFPEEAQLVIANEVARAFGYDFARGRLDKAVHPFSSGSGLDVRITTRTNPTDPFNCIYSTIHEVGHATYEQGIDARHFLTPLGQGASMGVHESQSRIYENQLGRSRAFTGWLYGRMRQVFGDFGVPDEETFHRAVNRVSDGYVRTEADEVQYNLHVLLRFDLEQPLMRGDLQVADLEAAWNDRFRQDFGFALDRPSHGLLQDVHWSVGLFGYFPTYSLGNVYAGCLHKALRDAVPELDGDLARGDTSRAVGWLRENLQRHGGLREPRQTVATAVGFDPSEGPLLDYLEAKFGDLYGL
ncbi:Thermostable carboxypeptidase 1 [Rubellimicrobium mesophilum DSM 19309]|uniref:Metal-dependent carboxypeptidase n=1 Tax=Rubellimicrobium mesophilum DSM 19309 TaxID=442562 RepID=A0A017HIJ7_9RHOB|nr:carboxypeptidase M32 [Rubellimicrobium mesophilum]EYD73584.1 Thermostable carboxypeptidase 1 [Rubellimicrobium mesophilum DSM 19309]